MQVWAVWLIVVENVRRANVLRSSSTPMQKQSTHTIAEMFFMIMRLQGVAMQTISF